MAGAMRKMAVYLGLVEDDFDGDYESDHVDVRGSGREQYAAPASEARPRPAPELAVRPTPTAVAERPVATLKPTGSTSGADMYRITTLHPRSYNDARRIGEEYRAGAPVIMNLTDMDDSDAKRIIDFGAGLVFAMHGTMEKITAKVFLLSPANVDVRDAPAVQQARDGFFNQS